jgi:phosphoglycerate dehydrogenase-like enzyme
MKPKVLSILPRERFENAEVSFPAALEFSFKHVTVENDIIEACQGVDFLFVPAAFPPITPAVLDNIPSVRMIQSAGTGYDKVDTASAARCNIPNYSLIREKLFTGGLKEISDLHLGLVGFGAIGRKVAQVAGLLGARVSYFDVLRPDRAIEEQLKVIYKDFEDLLRTSDAVSIHTPLSKQTYHLIDRRELRLMAPGSILINTARGEIVAPDALADALEDEQLMGAAIDTLYPEPPPSDHPLLNLSKAARDRLLITPHIAGTTKSAFQRMLSQAVANIAAVADGHPPKHVVNGVVKARESNP